MRKFIIAAIATVSLAANAQIGSDYPTKPIRFVLISAPGSGGDALGRMIADKMAPLLKATFVLDNKPGASGAIATDIVAKAPADGYTIGIGGYTTHALLPAINPKLPYDSIKDFAPIGQIGTASILLVATNDHPANNLKEFIAYAKSNAGTQYASWGNGSTGHLCGELISQKKQLKLSHIPYKSVAQIQTDMLGGHIKLAFIDMASGTPMVKSGRLKALGACTARTPSLPNIQSYEDEGIDFDGKRPSPPMWALYAPAATPRPVMDKLEAALKAVIAMPEVKTKLLEFGVNDSFMGGQEFRESLAATVQAWKQIAKVANITLE